MIVKIQRLECYFVKLLQSVESMFLVCKITFRGCPMFPLLTDYYMYIFEVKSVFHAEPFFRMYILCANVYFYMNK